MKSALPKKEQVNQKWYLVDAKDKVLGRISTIIANKLRGKDKPCFSPHIDCGDFVVIINCDKVKLTGTKLDKKKYFRHSGYPGGLKEKTAQEILDTKPKKILELSIRGMLPKNKLRKVFMNKLKLYTGDSHPHESQKPELLEI